MMWTASASMVALLTKNPWYLLLLTCVAVLVRWKEMRIPPGPWYVRLYLSLLLFPALLNLLFSRSGRTILLEIPIRWIGGPYTLEALVFGIAAGLQIAGLLTVMMVFSDLVSAQDLLRRIPRGYYAAGVTASIGLTFLPQARQAFTALQEARQVRGYKPKGMRDLPRIVTPLVILSLERAIGVAESLVSRGWSETRMLGWQRWALGFGWLGLGLSLSLWILLPAAPLLALFTLILSLLMLWAAFRSTERGSRFRPDVWTWPDSVITGLAIGTQAVFLILAILIPSRLVFSPYPSVMWPEFDWPLAFSLLLFSAPLWVSSND